MYAYISMSVLNDKGGVVGLHRMCLVHARRAMLTSDGAGIMLLASMIGYVKVDRNPRFEEAERVVKCSESNSGSVMELFKNSSSGVVDFFKSRSGREVESEEL